MLTQAELKELLHYDPATGVFTWLVAAAKSIKVCSIAGNLKSSGYNHIQIKGKGYLAHRLAWLYVKGCWPEAEIDHLNRIRNDNRIDNLRDVTHMQNRCNTSNNVSGVPGVAWHKLGKKWQVQIRVAGKSKSLGYFTNIEDAAAARREAELKYYGVNAL
jgi:HNH endonuclease